MRPRSFVSWGVSIGIILVVGIFEAVADVEALQKPPQVWAEYDPNKGDFKPEIVKEETREGYYYRESYISAYVLDEEIRVFCKYKVKAGATHAPGLLDVHGHGGFANIPESYVRDGWAVMAHDYCGNEGTRKEYTKYPEKLIHGNQMGDKRVFTELQDKTPITDPKQTTEYLWGAIERRVISYLEQQKEVDKNRIGATGYSYGGTLMWSLGTDPRIKAVVAHFGIGYNEYWRSKRVWMYNVPYVEPPKNSGEAIYLAGIAPEAHVPYITAATLFLNGSNDHHGGDERGLESFKKFRPGVPWSFAVQARGHHDTDKLGNDAKLWLEKHVMGKDVFWPGQPASKITLDTHGVPQFTVEPASAERVTKVEIFYALKEPCSFDREWLDAEAVRVGNAWVGGIPVNNVDDFVFAYANITYGNNVVRSTDFNAVIPSKLGHARASGKTAGVP